jgi:hypothetical protein
MSQSSWLQSFLARKRSVEIEKAVDIDSFDDKYLRQFLQSTGRQSDDGDDHVDPNQSLSESKPAITGRDLLSAPTSPQSFILDNDGDIDDADDVDLAPADTERSLRLWNLPYKASAEDVLAFAAAAGVVLREVKIVMDKKKANLPSGTALATVTSTEEVDMAIDKLFGKPFMGRDFKLSAIESKSSARRTNGRFSIGANTRYFSDGDISTKCFNCGQVGHKQTDCANPAAMAPCHLCAGNDHDAIDCQNITCFRCGNFGHHSKKCRQAYSAMRLALCTNCGSTAHDSVNCEDYIQSYDHSSSPFFISKNIICISCMAVGHSLCGKLSSELDPVDGLVYCPNCGNSGHHVDEAACSINRKGKFVPCLAPRVDAYQKIPQLMKDAASIDIASSNANSSKHDLMEYYRGIGRDQRLYPDQLEALFPVLAPAKEVDYSRVQASNHRNHSRQDSIAGSNSQRSGKRQRVDEMSYLFGEAEDDSSHRYQHRHPDDNHRSDHHNDHHPNAQTSRYRHAADAGADSRHYTYIHSRQSNYHTENRVTMTHRHNGGSSRDHRQYEVSHSKSYQASGSYRSERNGIRYN